MGDVILSPRLFLTFPMSPVQTYLTSPSVAGLATRRTRLLFRAWIDRGPGDSEMIEMRIGPTKCDRFDALWLSSDLGPDKFAVAWIPRGVVTGDELWQSLIEAYWIAERDVNEWDEPNFSEVIEDKVSILSSKAIDRLRAKVWP